MTAGGTDRELLAYLYRVLDMLPWVPESMSRTLQTSCLKTIQRLAKSGCITPYEAVQLSNQTRSAVRDRQPSRCGFEDKE